MGAKRPHPYRRCFGEGYTAVFGIPYKVLHGNTEHRGKSAMAAPKARITTLEPHLSTPWHLGVHRVADAMLMPQVCMWCLALL